MNPFDLLPAYREALSIFEAFRRLGFRADDIYFQVGGHIDKPEVVASPSGPRTVGPGYQAIVVLMSQGLRFDAVVGFLDQEPATIEETWQALAQAIMDGHVASADLDRLWAESEAFAHGIQLIFALLKKGFVLPRAPGLGVIDGLDDVPEAVEKLLN